MIEYYRKNQTKPPSLRGGTTRHQTAGLPFCHAKRPEGLGAGAERQSFESAVIPKRTPSLRGGTTRQSPEFAVILNKTLLLQTGTVQMPIWNHGSVMRLPQSFLPRNDGVLKKNNLKKHFNHREHKAYREIILSFSPLCPLWLMTLFSKKPYKPSGQTA